MTREHPMSITNSSLFRRREDPQRRLGERKKSHQKGRRVPTGPKPEKGKTQPKSKKLRSRKPSSKYVTTRTTDEGTGTQVRKTPPVACFKRTLS